MSSQTFHIFSSHQIINNKTPLRPCFFFIFLICSWHKTISTFYSNCSIRTAYNQMQFTITLCVHSLGNSPNLMKEKYSLKTVFHHSIDPTTSYVLSLLLWLLYACESASMCVCMSWVSYALCSYSHIWNVKSYQLKIINHTI